MKKFATLFGLTLISLLGGCGPGEGVYAYREGASVTQQQQVVFDCRVAAAKDVPSNTQVYTTPGHYFPGRLVCDGRRCYEVGGYRIPGRVESYDANAPLRRDYYARCLQQEGYTPLVVPNCPKDSVPASAYDQLAGKLQPPRPDACRVSIGTSGSNLVTTVPAN